ncbi:MAG TPA: hypothetical protein VFM33_13215, partial [Aquabacterium sp.]|nr:hypothetical protein [Aquabacterium sp.]
FSRSHTLPDASSSLADLTSLSDSLTAVTQSFQSLAAQQRSTLYFDYVGLSMFPLNEVSALKHCVEDMISEAFAQTEFGRGSLFLSVYAWPQH